MSVSLDFLSQQNKQLQERLDRLEEENRALKNSIYQLSLWHNLALSSPGRVQPFDFDQQVTKMVQELRYTNQETTRNVGNTKNTNTMFRCKYDLHGHEGAVYMVKFSPTGHLLASGSYDKTIRIWDVECHQPQVSCLAEHKALISDLDWYSDSSKLVTTSYDKTVRVWDIKAPQTSINTFNLTGFGLCSVFNPTDHNLVIATDSKQMIFVFDARVSTSPILQRMNDSSVHSMYSYKEGQLIMCGCQNGLIKTFDFRKFDQEAVQCFDNCGSNKPISCLSVSANPNSRDDEGRYLAVNSYDDVLYIYDRGSFVDEEKSPTANIPKLFHSLRGHQNRNWPIRSSFYHGRNYSPASLRQPSAENERQREISQSEQKMDVSASLLVATGSSDSNAYVFDIGKREGEAELRQVLSGHKDRVFCVNFHPNDPILATSSSDFTIKIWTTKLKISSQFQ